VPDDLLHHVFGPQPYSSWWLWWAVLLLLIVIGWYAGIFVWTLPSDRLRRLPVVRRAHARLIRNRFARCVQRIADEHDAGRMSAPAACAAVSRTVRSFLHQATGARAQYLQVGAMADADLAAAAPLLSQLGDAQFNAEARVDVADLSARTQELIRSWT
jgi:aminoglycoside/choline kinase family phosphotransferase